MKRVILTALVFVFASILGVTGKPVAIKGVVSSGDKGLPKMVVSDGYGFAITDAKGRFSIGLNDEATMLFVVTPAGYVAPYSSGVPLFFQNIERGKKQYDFELEPYGNTESYTLLAIADPQTQNDRHMNRFARETIEDLKSVAADYSSTNAPAVGIALGDICWDVLSLLPRTKELFASTKIPFYTVIGNHDHDKTLKGDKVSAREYSSVFGPTYYAMNIGRDYYVVLDNIVYDTNQSYKEIVDDRQLQWLQSYLTNYVPEGSHVIVCMHAPASRAFAGKGVMKSTDELLKILAPYKARFMSGHSHLNSNFDVTEGVVEHNVAAASGAWWSARTSKDGTPCGYQIFHSKGDDFSWNYKSVGKPYDYQFELYNLGKFAEKANSVVAKVWNWDPKWKVEWSEDGRPMGEMSNFKGYDPHYRRYLQKRADAGETKVWPYKRPVESFFYFEAIPSPYAKSVEVKVTDRFGKVYTKQLNLDAVDVQAHRGGMGLMPENTIEAMINAVKLGVNTLELDLNISSDNKVVVSHDPYMNYKFVTAPDGSQITKENTKEYALYKMTYDSIARFDTGMKPHPNYPDQKKLACHKPLLSDLIDAVERFTKENGYPAMKYNIEIKSDPDKDNIFTPPYKEFTDLAMEVLLSKNLGDRLVVQSFDVRGLNYLHEKYPQVILSYLVDKGFSDFEANMSQLNFVPQWYSPHLSLVNAESLAQWRAKGMKIVPWTVDKIEDIKKLVDLKVDAIISNYPDRVLSVTRKY